MKLCKFWFDCQPEVMRNCCRNGGVWKDKRLKNYGKKCGFYEQYEKMKKEGDEQK